VELADQRSQFFRTQPDDPGLEDLVAEHGSGLGSKTATKAQLLTGGQLEE